MRDDPITPFTLPQFAFASFPSNLPADECLRLLRERRGVTFAARPLPPCFKLKLTLGGKVTGLPMSGWAVIASPPIGAPSVVLIGLSECDALFRAAELNKPRAATGFHSVN